MSVMKKLCSYEDHNIGNMSKIFEVLENRADCKRDIISYLPELIRTHIVSFHPMKDAIRTTILSRRWRKISTSLSNLEFHSCYFKNLVDFKNFVDKMLIRHDGSDVRKFDIGFYVNDEIIPADHLNEWVTFAIDHNVEHLELDHFPNSKIERLPCRFFTCRTVSYMYLKCLRKLKWPTLINFPNLTELILQMVAFHDENVTSKLFSNSACPKLERLSILYCNFKRIKALSISFSTLKYLQLHCDEPLTVNLSISILPELNYACPLQPNIGCETLSSIRHGSFDFDVPDSISGELAIRNSVRKILTGLHNVENLTLSCDIIEILTRDPDLLSYLPASYYKVNHFLFTIMPTKSHVEVIACLLKTSPSLQTLNIRFEKENPTYSDLIHRQGYWESNELSIAECLKHLKRVNLINFGGKESEMDILRRLLESARALEKINIAFQSEIENDAEKGMIISKKLSSFRRVSPHATIIFL